MYLYICIALSSVTVHAQHSCKMPKTMAWILVYEIEFIGFRNRAAVRCIEFTQPVEGQECVGIVLDPPTPLVSMGFMVMGLNTYMASQLMGPEGSQSLHCMFVTLKGP